MKTAAAVFGLIISLAVVSTAQVRTVTNATLERFQQKRLAAERDYRDNYERMGFPSPEELDRQREADMTARLELADQLRESRLAKERLELDRQRLALDSAQFDAQMEVLEEDERAFYGGYLGGGFFGGFGGGSFDNRFGKFRRHRPFGFFPRRNQLRIAPGLPRVTRITPFGVQPARTSRGSRLYFGGGKRR